MKLLITDFIHKNYRVALFKLAFLYVLFLIFRWELLALIQAIYPNTVQVSFFFYLSLSFSQDLAVIFLLWSFLFILDYFSAKKAPLQILGNILVLQALVFFLFMALVFFRIYEQPITTSHWSHGANEGYGNLLSSALSEIQPEQILFLALLSALLWTGLLFFTLSQRRHRENKFPARLPDTKSWIWHFTPFFALTLILLLFPVLNSKKQEAFAANLRQDRKLNLNAISFDEFRENPLFGLLKNKRKEEIHLKQVSEKKQAKFSYSFNTSSLSTGKIYPRMYLVPRKQKYNIILYFFESTPKRYLGTKINGKSITPNWDSLQKKSFVAQNHYTNSPLSVNALFTVLSSAYSLPNNRWIPQDYPDINLKSLPEILHDHGYRTMLIHPGNLGYAWQREYLVKRKFDRITEYDDLVGREYSKVINWGLDDLSMIRPSIQFMEEDRKKPFFIVYQPVTPHHPFEVPDDKYRITGKIAGKLDYKKRNWLNYLNSLHYADSVLGEVIRNLEKKGLLENTLFFLMSDHGEAFYQHTRNYNHPFFLYEENVQVPFLIYNPHLFPQGYSYNGISRHLDIAPSILDLLGIPKEERHEGISLFSAHQEQMAMLHTFWNRDISAIRDGNWKYIRKMDSAEEELYDLALDPAEKKNLAALRPAITASYREKILALRQYKNRFFKTVTGNKFPERNEKRSSEKFR